MGNINTFSCFTDSAKRKDTVNINLFACKQLFIEHFGDHVDINDIFSKSNNIYINKITCNIIEYDPQRLKKTFLDQSLSDEICLLLDYIPISIDGSIYDYYTESIIKPNNKNTQTLWFILTTKFPKTTAIQTNNEFYEKILELQTRLNTEKN